MFNCEIIRDSMYQTRLTTLEVTYPRFIHSEIMTHRDRARNAGSSRAIPWPTMCERIVNQPVVPIYWGMEQKGMQTGGELDLPDRIKAEHIWLDARDDAVKHAENLHKLGVHKSLCNRITEPFMWITVVMTSTDWTNFFNQRCHIDAEIHFQKIAGMMRDSIRDSEPYTMTEDQWHMPYIEQDDMVEVMELHDILTSMEILKKVSVARCARVSYVQHGEKRKSIQKDMKLCHDLINGSGEMGHRSPFEHVAQAKVASHRSGPFRGWQQLRKDVWNREAELETRTVET